MMMKDTDLWVENDKDPHKIYVASKMGTVGLRWPPVILHKGIQYEFYSNECIPDVADETGGFASYVRATFMSKSPIVPRGFEVEDEARGLEVEDEADYPRVEGITYLRLCEQDHIVLRPNRLYYFTVDKNCAKCVELAKKYQ